jgi:ArsR family transcriptional regulator
MVSLPSLFDQMAALSDPFRARLLMALERSELTVNELCDVFQLPQSTMSRHLKALVDEGWLDVRAKGTSRQYSMQTDLSAEARKLWQMVRDQVITLPRAEEDAERVRGVLAERRSRSQAFFSTAASEWDRIRAELVGRRLDLVGLLGLVDDEWEIGDLGCGTGQVAAAVAPFVRRVVAVDESPEMLSVARERLAPFTNAEVRHGELERLPLADGTLDAAVMFLVLHYLEKPARALAEVARVLRPRGRLLVVDLRSHMREEYRQEMGHLWMGFGSEQMEGWCREVGLEGFRHVSLPADPETRGPPLFAVSARAPEAARPHGQWGARP